MRNVADSAYISSSALVNFKLDKFLWNSWDSCSKSVLLSPVAQADVRCCLIETKADCKEDYFDIIPAGWLYDTSLYKGLAW